jgi:uroporphyrinogen decarboxylase
MNEKPRQRVQNAIDHQPTDRTPRDFAATPEIWQTLLKHFATDDRNAVLRRLGIDCRVVASHQFYTDSRPTGEADQSRDLWGALRRSVTNEYGTYDELTDYPLASATTVEEIDAHNWPIVEAFDFSTLRSSIESLHDDQRYHIRYRVGAFFEAAWSLVGIETFQLHMAMQPALAERLMERVAHVQIESTRRALDEAADLIDMVYCFDDVAMQDSLLMSPDMYGQFIQPHHQGLIDLAREYDKPTMMHCCGSVTPLLPRWIDMGLNVLNPIQTSARHMDPESLASRFGEKICFHGGVDIQQFLPTATPDEVRAEVKRLKACLGKHNGFILSGSHHFQPDTPLENILALYEPLDDKDVS